MKRCPACQTLYTDDSLSFCLQDGTKLAVVSDSSADVTWQMSTGGRGAAGEPPPTEIMRVEDMPTARVQPTPPTMGQQRARPTAQDAEQRPLTSAAAPRTNATVIALSVAVALLLVALGGIIVWALMRDKEQPRVATSNSNQDVRGQTSTTTARASSNTNSNANTSSANSSANASSVDIAALQKEVQAALNGWAETVRRRNLDEHIGYYADVLDVYYNATNVARDRVRADRAAAFSKYSSLDMQLSNVNITIDPAGTRATATFDKTFDFRGDGKSFNGSGLNRFWLVKTGGRWRITGEKDLKTYYVNK